MIRLLVLGLLALSCWAQPQSGIARHVQWGASLPAHCSPTTGDIFYVVSAGPVGVLYTCGAPDTWSVGTGAVSSVSGSPGIVTAPTTGAVVVAPDTGVLATNANLQLAEPLKCAGTGTSGAQVCSTMPTLTQYTLTWTKASTTLTSIAVATNVATATFSSNPGLTEGRRIIVTGATGDTDLNAVATITAVSSSAPYTATFATVSVADGTYTESTLVLRAVTGVRLIYTPGTTLSGTSTLNVDTNGAMKVFEANGTDAGTGTDGVPMDIIYDASLDTATGAFRKVSASAALPSAPTGRGFIPYPPGMYADMSGTQALTQNRVQLFAMWVPVQLTISKGTVKIATAQAASTMFMGIYDSTCATKLFEVSFASTATGAQTGTTTGVVIPAGWYYLALGNDTASVVVNGYGGGAGTAVYNQGTNVQLGYAANTISGGHLPSACGTITAGVIVAPDMVFHN